MSKNQEISDLKKIIKIQEKIINLKENEFQMVHKLFIHYLSRYEEFFSQIRVSQKAMVTLSK